MGTLVYKILNARAWDEARVTGVLAGSELDRADGYIHLSAGPQVAETLARHFTGAPDLVLVAFDADALGAGLRWEPSRGGDLFPHYYGVLSAAHAAWVAPLPLNGAGVHILPDALA